jgi:hypothetical protein
MDGWESSLFFFFTFVTLPYSPAPNSLFLACREIKYVNYNNVYWISYSVYWHNHKIYFYIEIYLKTKISKMAKDRLEEFTMISSRSSWRRGCMQSWPRIGSGSLRWMCFEFLGFPNLWFGLVDISLFGHHLPVDLLTLKIGIYYSYDSHWLWWIVLSLGMFLHLFSSCYMPGLLKI